MTSPVLGCRDTAEDRRVQAFEFFLCDWLWTWSVYSLGDTTDSLVGEISFLHLFFKAGSFMLGVNWSWNMGGSILFLPFQIPLSSKLPYCILLFHHAERDLPCILLS